MDVYFNRPCKKCDKDAYREFLRSYGSRDTLCSVLSNDLALPYGKPVLRQVRDPPFRTNLNVNFTITTDSEFHICKVTNNRVKGN